jgi:hypothetical protein
VSICAAAVSEALNILARCSVPEWVSSVADSGAVGGIHGTSFRARL